MQRRPEERPGARRLRTHVSAQRPAGRRIRAGIPCCWQRASRFWSRVARSVIRHSRTSRPVAGSIASIIPLTTTVPTSSPGSAPKVRCNARSAIWAMLLARLQPVDVCGRAELIRPAAAVSTRPRRRPRCRCRTGPLRPPPPARAVTGLPGAAGRGSAPLAGSPTSAAATARPRPPRGPELTRAPVSSTSRGPAGQRGRRVIVSAARRAIGEPGRLPRFAVLPRRAVRPGAPCGRFALVRVAAGGPPAPARARSGGGTSRSVLPSRFGSPHP